jgi:hypothetical protein
MRFPPTDLQHPSVQRPQKNKKSLSSRSSKNNRIGRWSVGLLFLAGIATLLVYITEPEYAYLPPLAKVLNAERGNQDQAFDVWGHAVSQTEATRLLQTSEGRTWLSPHNGAVRIDETVLSLGRTAFYRETFGNEIFLSDIMGILAGPLTPWRMAKALWQLGGKGTTNLQIPLDEDVTIGETTFSKGTVLNTGLDVVP